MHRKPLKPGRIRRVRGLDGFRGFAVLAVVIFHAFPGWLQGGFLGVDVFFVLSGFLITSLLIREYGATGTISLKNFWVRRLRRIFPAALTTLVIITAIAGLVGPDTNVNLGPQFLGTVFFVNNWVQIAQSVSYFADTGENITRHYWSLAIEEQFYILWPLLFIAIVIWIDRARAKKAARADSQAGSGENASLPRGETRGLLIAKIVVAVLAVVSAVLMAVLVDTTPGGDPSRVYYGTDTHAFGLLIGVLVALMMTDPWRRAKDSWPSLQPGWVDHLNATLFGLPAFVGIIAAFFLLSGDSAVAYQGGIAGTSVLTAVVIYTVVREAGPVTALLRNRVMCWLGTRSFSIYLLHWPVFVFVSHYLQKFSNGVGSWGFVLIGTITLVVSLALSEVSFRFVETPFHRRGYKKTLGSWIRRPYIPLLVVAALIGAGMAIRQSPAESSTEQALQEMEQKQQEHQQSSPRSQSPEDSGAASSSTPGAADAPKKFPDGSDITVVGDSVTLASSEALYQRFPGVYVDGAVSRHYQEGVSILQQLRDTGQLGHYVVLGFGTNGQAFPGQLTEIKDLIGPDRHLVIVEPYGLVNGVPEAAAQVEEFVHDHNDVYLAPWCQKALNHPETLRPDGIHPDPPGAELYADAVKEGIQQAVEGKQKELGKCEIF